MADGWCASLSPGNSPLSLAAVCRVHVHLPDMPSRMKREHPVASAPLPQPHKSSQTTVVDEQVIVEAQAEASPEFFAISRVHVHNPRKRHECTPRILAVQHVQRRTEKADSLGLAFTDDDDGHSCPAADLSSEGFEIQERWSPRLSMRKRSKPLTHPTTDQRIMQPAAVLAQLNVLELPTNGYNNNCLWFSVQRATGSLSDSEQYRLAGERASDTGRGMIHQELLRALPAAANLGPGNPDLWWAGMSSARARRVRKRKLMMSEAHIFAFADMLKRPICVVDTRARAVVIQLYQPGYSAKGLQLSLQEAESIRKRAPQCVWIRLHGIHFTALVPQISCMV